MATLEGRTRNKIAEAIGNLCDGGHLHWRSTFTFAISIFRAVAFKAPSNGKVVANRLSDDTNTTGTGQTISECIVQTSGHDEIMTIQPDQFSFTNLLVEHGEKIEINKFTITVPKSTSSSALELSLIVRNHALNTLNSMVSSPGGRLIFRRANGHEVATVNLSNIAFKNASNGVMSANTMERDDNPTGGKISYATLHKADGKKLVKLSVGVSGSGKEVIVVSLKVTSEETFTPQRMSVRLGA